MRFQVCLQGVWRRLLCSVLLAWLLFNVGCLGPIPELYPPKPGEPVKSVYLAGTGWHVALLLEAKDLEGQPWLPSLPEGTKTVEIGWGSRIFYLDRNYWPHAIFYAALIPNPSVIHLAPFRHLPEEIYRTEVIRLDLSEEGFQKLLTWIQGSFCLDDQGHSIRLAEGYYGAWSGFYDAEGYYGVWKTCNGWTARGLREAGCPVTPFYAVFASNLMYQARRTGTVLQVAP